SMRAQPRRPGDAIPGSWGRTVATAAQVETVMEMYAPLQTTRSKLLVVVRQADGVLHVRAHDHDRLHEQNGVTADGVPSKRDRLLPSDVPVVQGPPHIGADLDEVGELAIRGEESHLRLPNGGELREETLVAQFLTQLVDCVSDL